MSCTPGHGCVAPGAWLSMCHTLDVPYPTPVSATELEAMAGDVALLSAPQARFVSNRDVILANPQVSTCISTIVRGRSLTGVKQVCVCRGHTLRAVVEIAAAPPPHHCS